MITATAIKERPILFSGSMVRAILDGRKTQTRRIMKPQPTAESHDEYTKWCWPANDDAMKFAWAGQSPISDAVEGHCPYGTIGDRLWVRETWGKTRQCDDLNSTEGDVIAYRAGGTRVWNANPASPKLMRFGANHYYDDPKPWKPSIHMPRWASRITLEITSVRVEQLQQISDQDALSEGIPVEPTTPGIDHCIDGEWWPGRPVQHFRNLWQSINGDDSWGLNPWVWVVEFDAVEVLCEN